MRDLMTSLTWIDMSSLSATRCSRWPSGTIPSTAQRTARLLVLGFELADHSLGLVGERGEDLVGFSSA